MPTTDLKISPRMLQRHAKELILLKQKLEPIKKQFKKLKREMIGEMQQSHVDDILTRIGELKLICTSRDCIDMKAFKRLHPHIYNELCRTRPVNTLIFDIEGCEDEEED